MTTQISLYQAQFDDRKNHRVVYQEQPSAEEKISMTMMKRSIRSGIDIERLYQSGQELTLDVVGCKSYLL